MLSSAIGLLLGALASFLNDWLAGKRAEDNLKDAGRLQAERDTQQIISEIADDQARNNAAPQSLQSVIDGLRNDK